MTENDDRLWIHVIYERPSDYPNSFLVRRQSPNADGTILVATNCIIAPSLEIAREMLEFTFPGLYRLPREENDDPVIVETWI